MSTEEPAPPKYLKLKAIAQELDVSESVIKRLIYRGELPGIKVGKEHRVERSAYEKWKLEHSNQAEAKDAARDYNEDSLSKLPDSSTLPPQQEGKP